MNPKLRKLMEETENLAREIRNLKSGEAKRSWVRYLIHLKGTGGVFKKL